MKKHLITKEKLWISWPLLKSLCCSSQPVIETSHYPLGNSGQNLSFMTLGDTFRDIDISVMTVDIEHQIRFFFKMLLSKNQLFQKMSIERKFLFSFLIRIYPSSSSLPQNKLAMKHWSFRLLKLSIKWWLKISKNPLKRFFRLQKSMKFHLIHHEILQPSSY